MPKAPACLLACILLPAAAAALELPALFPDTVPIGSETPRGKIETYSTETLWEKINGEAELFRRFGFLGAAFARYEQPGDIDRSLEVAVYVLPDSLSAFGLFATFTSPEEPQAEFGNGAVIGSYQGYLWHGGYFVIVSAFGPAEDRALAVKEAISRIAATLDPPPPTPPSLEAFRKVVDPATISYRPDHLFGREVLPPGLEGNLTGGTRIFAAMEKVLADEILAAYSILLEDPREWQDGGATLLSGTDSFLGPVIIAATEDRLAGARALPDEESLTEILLQLLKNR